MINAKSDLPFNGLDGITSRLTIGVVNLLRGQPTPDGPSLRQAYLPFNAAWTIAMVALSAWAARARRIGRSVTLLGVAVAIVTALGVSGLNPRVLSTFAPDVASVVAAALVLLCWPAALSAVAWARRAYARTRRQSP